MINLRYHLVSLAAVLFALAAGIALGAGLLDDAGASLGDDSDRQQDVSPAVAGFDAAYAEVTSPELIRDTLRDQSVIVFTTPGAPDAQVEDVVENLQNAGATVTGRVGLTNKLLSAGNRQFAEGVATQSTDDDLSADDAYGRIAMALGYAYLADGWDEERSRTIRSAFTQGDLIDEASEPDQGANLAVVIAGPPSEGEDADHGAVVAQLAPTLDSMGDGLLVAGPVASSDERGVVGRVRSADDTSELSTFDVTDTATGRIATVLALVREADGASGAWGTSRSADGPMP